jgi:hypothetical protein
MKTVILNQKVTEWNVVEHKGKVQFAVTILKIFNLGDNPILQQLPHG